MSTTAEIKAQGDAAFKAGEFNASVEHYTSAIAMALSENADKDIMRALYSNRSGAYMSLKKFADALADGKQCTTLDSQWIKGHLRVGDAHDGARNFTAAYNAYNAAWRIDNNDANVLAKRDRASNMMAAAAERESAARGGSSTGSAFFSGSGSGGGGGSAARSTAVQGLLGTMQSYARIASMVCFVLYLVPFFPYSVLLYRACIAGAVLGGGIGVHASAGSPALSMEYAQKVMSAPGGMHLFLSFLLLATRPYFLAAAPLMIIPAADMLVSQLAKASGARLDLSSIPSYLQSMAGNAAQLQQSMEQLASPGGQQRVLDLAAKAAVQCEVYQGVFLIVELVLPSRNFMLLYLWWQYLLMRYVLEAAGGRGGQVKVVFAELDHTISGYLSHPLLPTAARGPLQGGYNMLRTFLAAQVTKTMGGGAGAGAGAGGGLMGGLSGLAKSCTVC